jgi:hypothetical protein
MRFVPDFQNQTVWQCDFLYQSFGHIQGSQQVVIPTPGKFIVKIEKRQGESGN